MAAIFQRIFSNAFSWMKIYKFRSRFHWSLFPRVQSTIFQHWYRKWLGTGQATSHYLNQWWPALLMHICVTQPQWVKIIESNTANEYTLFSWEWYNRDCWLFQSITGLMMICEDRELRQHCPIYPRTFQTQYKKCQHASHPMYHSIHHILYLTPGWLDNLCCPNVLLPKGTHISLTQLDCSTDVILQLYPDSKVHGANMGPTLVLPAPDGPHVGPMNLAIRVKKK